MEVIWVEEILIIKGKYNIFNIQRAEEKKVIS